MYRLNKEAKRFRDLKREYYDNDYTLTKDVFDAIIELTEDEYNSVSFDEEMGYVGSYYYGVLKSLDELEDSLMDSQTEISDIEYKLDNIDEYEEEDEEELRERLEDEENDREKLIKFIDELTSFERINPFTLFKEQIDRLYSLKNEVLDSLIGKDEKGKSDGIHKFENGDIRYLYELGDYSFHGRDLVDEISSEEYDEAEEIEEISSKNILAIDMSIEEAIDNLENFLKSGVRFRMSTDTPDIELQRIKDKAIADGTFMKAPNGNPTHLNERQWLQVRTKAFKNWFGDWEKSARVEKLRKARPVVLQGNEHEGKYELNRDSAKKWIKENLRGEYVVGDTQEEVQISRVGVNKVTSHSMGNEAHLKKPELLKSSVFIAEENSDKKGAKYAIYRYYVAGMRIGGVDYTVKLTIGVDENGNKFYDHALTEIEKGSLTNNLNGLSNSMVKNETSNSFISTGLNPSVAESKDIKLISLLQTNSSKVVDENGEPLVVYRGTPENPGYIFEYGKSFYGGNLVFWFTTSKEGARDYSFNEESGEYVDIKAVFLNATDIMDFVPLGRNTTTKRFNDYVRDNFDIHLGRGSSKELRVNEAYQQNASDLYPGSHDAIKLVDVGHTYIVKRSDQIKSATDNVGTFDSNNADIRFRRDETTIRGYVEGNNEDGFRREENDMLLSRTHEDRMRENPLAYDALFDRAGVEGVARLVGENLGINVRVASRNSVKKSRRKEKGFFDVAKSEVVVFFENLRSERSLTDFVLQTVVLNKGISSVLGESQYSTVKQHIYSSLLDTSKYMLLESFPEATEEELEEECLVRISEHFLDSETIKGIAKEVRSILYAKGLNTSLRDGEKETIETFENEMKELEQDGKALSLNPQQERPNLPFRSDKMAEKEHVVRVLFNGVERRVYMN